MNYVKILNECEVLLVKYGQIVVGKITDENEQAYYAQYEGITFELNKKTTEDTYTLGETVEGMIYENRFSQKVMQTELPLIRPGYYGWGTVISVRKDLGVFIDVGLEEKDVVMSLDYLPENKQLWPKKGDKLYLTFFIDDKNRFWGQFAEVEQFNQLFKKAPERLMNQELKVTVYQVKLAGALAISEEGFRVFIHESEQTETLRLGQEVTVRVVNVARDGSLNGSMRPRAHEAITDDAQMILAILDKAPNGFLALHDKSDPEAIQAQLGISKAQFKRAIGNLLKNKKIRQEKNEGIYQL